ncbi:TPT domain-containing protein [Mycena kentingensis (nom. inval.)]|nr:TPT domain-containing protein [Mycena kentingensis (nom. inval.)]
MQPSQNEPSRIQVAAVVFYYITAALVMVVANKAVLNSNPDLPFTFLWLQVFIAVCLLRLLALLQQTRYHHHVPEFHLPSFNRVIFSHLLPYLAVGIAGLVFNTLCLKGVDAAFFQVARGMLLPFTIVVSAINLGTRPSKQTLLAAGIVTLGFLMSSAPAFYHHLTIPVSPQRARISSESALGLFYGLVSSLLLSVHAVLKKSALGHVQQSVVTLSYCGNLFSTITLIPCIVLHGELAVLKGMLMNPETVWRPFIVGVLVTGVFGFLLNISHSLSIKVTSPITHMFSSAAKGVIQTLLGMWIFGDILTQTRAYSILTITAGTVYYTYVQSQPKPRPLTQVYKTPADVEKQIWLPDLHFKGSQKTLGDSEHPAGLTEEKRQVA